MREVEGKYITWLAPQNQWILMEEPAKEVFEMLQQRTSNYSIVNHCMLKYETDLTEALKFTRDIRNLLRGTLKSGHVRNEDIWRVETGKHTQSQSYSLRKYSIISTVLSIAYETAKLEDSIHPLFSSLEVKTGKPKIEFKMNWCEDILALTVVGVQSKSWVSTKPEFIKGRLFLEIINAIHNKTEQDWMTVAHGTVVSNSTGSILLAASSGGGKSTLATLLALEGLEILTDEIVPIEAGTNQVYPFPAAVSAKESSWELLLPHFPELAKAKSYNKTEKQVKYLPLAKNGNPGASGPRKIKAIVFVDYNPGVEFSAIRAGRIETVRKFNEETWIQPTLVNSEIYLDWITKIRAYNLSYSNNQKAVEFVSFLLDNL